MIADFDIQVQPSRNLVKMRLSGFFTPADIKRFILARDEAHEALRCGPNEHSTLVDIRDMDIQSQEAVTQFQQTLDNPAMASKRLAIVLAEKSLCRLQIRRAASNRDAFFTDSLTEAEAYLRDRASVIQSVCRSR